MYVGGQNGGKEGETSKTGEFEQSRLSWTNPKINWIDPGAHWSQKSSIKDKLDRSKNMLD